MAADSFMIQDLNWTLSTGISGLQAASQQTNWNELCAIASQLRQDLPCKPLEKMINGGNYLVRLLEFSDKAVWVARVSLSPNGGERLQREAGLLKLIRDRKTVPVPEVFACDGSQSNPVGRSYMLMEFIPGNTAMDASGGYDVHMGRIPEVHRNNFYRSVADCHKQIASLRFPKIGTVTRRDSGEYDIGPFSDIGGPFDTATEYFTAWAKHAEFPMKEERIRQLVGPEHADEVADGIRDFPSHIKASAHRLSFTDSGPFPLCHGDFWHSNMIINNEYDVLAIIDWESTCTLPWELVSPPGFIRAVPTEFDPPKPCDENGLPLDNEDRERLENRQRYIEMVKEAEGSDHSLSKHLEDERSLALAYCVVMYGEGKMGFYDRVAEKLGI